MRRFRDELKIIPFPAWLIALASFACMALVLLVVAIPQDAEMRRWPLLGSLCFSVGVSGVVLVFVLLIGYINGDAKRRGMRHVLWTFIAIFVPNAIGIILYFVMRQPVVDPCPGCGVRVRSTFSYCPNCGTQLRRACPSCRQCVEPGWKTCAYCGINLMEPAGPAVQSIK